MEHVIYNLEVAGEVEHVSGNHEMPGLVQHVIGNLIEGGEEEEKEFQDGDE